jgi:hypothetical protein
VRVAPGGAWQGRRLGRSSLRFDSAAVLRSVALRQNSLRSLRSNSLAQVR